MLALKCVDADPELPEICREFGAIGATFCKWCAEFGGTNTARKWGMTEHEDADRPQGTCALKIIKLRKRLVGEKPEVLAVPDVIYQVWSLDAKHDNFEGGKSSSPDNLHGILYLIINKFTATRLLLTFYVMTRANAIVFG